VWPWMMSLTVLAAGCGDASVEGLVGQLSLPDGNPVDPAVGTPVLMDAGGAELAADFEYDPGRGDYTIRGVPRNLPVIIALDVVEPDGAERRLATEPVALADGSGRQRSLRLLDVVRLVDPAVSAGGEDIPVVEGGPGRPILFRWPDLGEEILYDLEVREEPNSGDAPPLVKKRRMIGTEYEVPIPRSSRGKHYVTSLVAYGFDGKMVGATGDFWRGAMGPPPRFEVK